MIVAFRTLFLAIACTIMAGCATPAQQLHSFKAQYFKASAPKALYWSSFNGTWAAGAAGWPSASSDEAARNQVKRQCELKAAEIGLFRPCRPYFLNDEFVLGRVDHHQALQLARGETPTPEASPTPSAERADGGAKPEGVSADGGPGCAENGSCYGDISDLTGRPKTVPVRGYYRKDGTYVRGHYRSKPKRR